TRPSTVSGGRGRRGYWSLAWPVASISWVRWRDCWPVTFALSATSCAARTIALPCVAASIGRAWSWTCPSSWTEWGSHGLPCVPTLILAGDRDLLVSPQSLRDLADGIPRSRLVHLRGCGHLAFATQPDRVADEVRQFLSDG